MIPSVLQELKEGRYKNVITNCYGSGCEYYYTTESNQKIYMFWAVYGGWTVRVNGKRVSWFFGWRIRRALKKGKK